MGGLYALAIQGAPTEALKKTYLNAAAGITETCHESYVRSATGLGPEMMLFDASHEVELFFVFDAIVSMMFIRICFVQVTTSKATERYYILRPETFEAYFYMWRLTHDEKYREWAWQAVEALEEHAKCVP